MNFKRDANRKLILVSGAYRQINQQRSFVSKKDRKRKDIPIVVTEPNLL